MTGHIAGLNNDGPHNAGLEIDELDIGGRVSDQN